MPAYFDMTIQRRTDKLSDTYVESLYTAIMEAGYPFKSGFWFHEDATYDEIVVWNQSKLRQGFRLGFTENGSHDYMQILFDAPLYRELRGFWMYGDADVSFHLIIPEADVLNDEGGDTVVESKIAPLRALAAVIWEKGLADAIQTSVELDGGCYSADDVARGKNVMAHPFAVLPRDAAGRFPAGYFDGRALRPIAGGGLLVDSGNTLPVYFLLE